MRNFLRPSILLNETEKKLLSMLVDKPLVNESMEQGVENLKSNNDNSEDIKSFFNGSGLTLGEEDALRHKYLGVGAFH